MVVYDRASISQIAELTTHVVPPLPVVCPSNPSGQSVTVCHMNLGASFQVSIRRINAQMNYLTGIHGSLYLLIGTSNSAFGSTRVDTSRRVLALAGEEIPS